MGLPIDNVEIIKNAASNDSGSGGGSIFQGIISIVQTVGGYFTSREQTKQAELELAQLQKKLETEQVIAEQQVIIESIKLKQLELTNTRKSQNSKNLLVGFVILVLVVLVGFVSFLFLRPAPEKIVKAPPMPMPQSVTPMTTPVTLKPQMSLN